MTVRLASISDAMLEKRKEDARKLREMADQVEAGEVTEFVVVANNKAEVCFFAIGCFDDRWRILGALEYAKQTVHEN